jgi:Cu-Zn family superoxide dismutase
MSVPSYVKSASLFLLLTLGGTAVAVVTQSAPKPKTLEVILSSSSQTKASGIVSFTELKDKQIAIEGNIIGLSVGEHGMHIHDKGNCSDVADGFKKSAGHFNPTKGHHGSLISSGHAGDLGNIVADAKGKAYFKIETSKFNLIKDDAHSILGKALVVHAGQDDEKTDPAGNSGGRILCGVIQ